MEAHVRTTRDAPGGRCARSDPPTDSLVERKLGSTTCGRLSPAPLRSPEIRPKEWGAPGLERARRETPQASLLWSYAEAGRVTSTTAERLPTPHTGFLAARLRRWTDSRPHPRPMHKWSETLNGPPSPRAYGNSLGPPTQIELDTQSRPPFALHQTQDLSPLQRRAVAAEQQHPSDAHV